MTEAQAATTRGFARALGPFLILFPVAIASRAADMGMLASGFFQDGPLTLVTGAFTLAIGCAMLAAHHHFNSLPAIIITIFGVITALRGFVLVVAPMAISAAVDHLTLQPGVIYIPTAAAVLIGLYLSFAGWFSKKA